MYLDGVSESDNFVTSGKGLATVKAKINNKIIIYNTNGSEVKTVIAGHETTEIPLLPGIYVICVNGESFKTVIY